MATVQRRLVHKQFNSPIALYSDQNVKETLNRELKVLSSGAVGIDFDDPSTTRPGMLAKSAVLAALEDEERTKRGQQTGLKRVAWPPPPESTYTEEVAEEQLNQPGQTQQYQLPAQQQLNQPQYCYQPPQEQPVQQTTYQTQAYQPQQTQLFKPVTAPQPFQGVPLRKEAPIHQRPAPVFPSQPAAANFQGGMNSRGDQKWPPAEYKQQAEVENEERLKLAHGPAFRPKRVNKDYSRFFAQNALNATYPGYRVPPGTQHHGINNSYNSSV